MRKRSIVEGITPQARRAWRRELGKLRDLAIKPATQRRYEEAATIFFAYLKANKEPLPTQPHDLDQIVGHYLEELWWDGQSKSLAGDTFSSLQHREPSLKRQLRWSWKLFKAWQQAEIPSRSPPFYIANFGYILRLGSFHQTIMGFGAASGFSWFFTNR